MKLKSSHGQARPGSVRSRLTVRTSRRERAGDARATKDPQRAAWGRKGGESRSAFKLAASRTTIAEARNHLLSKRTCQRCRQRKLGWGNKSGVCRACQRNPAATLAVAG